MASADDNGIQKTTLTRRMSLISPAARPISGRIAAGGEGVLGGSGEFPAGPTIPFSDFVPAEAPVLLAEPQTDGIILGTASGEPAGDEIAAIEFAPDPDEEGVYLLLQEIETPDGSIYEVCLPATPDQSEPLVLGDSGAPATLRFPIHRLVRQPGGGPVLGGPLEALAEELVQDFIFRRIVHLLRAPLTPSLQQLIADREGPPAMVVVAPDATLLGPLVGTEMWRGRFEPGYEHRVLVFMHGFSSNVRESLPRAWIRELGPRYDAVLAYNHPTFSADPLQNARELLSQIPDDLRLNVDLLAHSRGGLVARALVELLPATPSFAVQRLLTCGTPHDGTGLVEKQRWDQLASIVLTSASWLLQSTGVVPLAVVPQLLEYLLRAGGQFFFDLPGIYAMAPRNPFLTRLNEPNDEYPVPYAAVTSTFDPQQIAQVGFREALQAMTARAFLGTPNDLVVPTTSMSAIDPPFSPQLAGWIMKLQVNHHAYFDTAEALSFARQFLFGEW